MKAERPAKGPSPGDVPFRVRAVLSPFLPLLALMGANLLFPGKSDLDTNRPTIADKTRRGTEMSSSIARDTLAAVVADTKYLAQLNEVAAYTTAAAETSSENALLRAIGREFLAFVSTRSTYDQIRFLDPSGMEPVRVNYNAGKPEIVPTSRPASSSRTAIPSSLRSTLT